MAYFYEKKTALALNAEKKKAGSQAVFFWLRDDVCVYVDASESRATAAEFFVMLRKALPFLVYTIVVREVSVRLLEDVIRTISVVKAEQLLQHRAFFFSLFLSQFFRKCISKTRWIHSNYFKTVLKTFERRRKIFCICSQNYSSQIARESARARPFKLF